MLKLFLFLEFLHHFGITVAKQGLDEIIFQRAIKVYLIPVFLIPMPCAFYFGMLFPEFEGVIGITFHRNPFGALQVNTGKDLAQNTKHQGPLIKRKNLDYEGKREAILSNRFYINYFFTLN